MLNPSSESVNVFIVVLQHDTRIGTGKDGGLVTIGMSIFETKVSGRPISPTATKKARIFQLDPFTNERENKILGNRCDRFLDLPGLHRTGLDKQPYDLLFVVELKSPKENLEVSHDKTLGQVCDYLNHILKRQKKKKKKKKKKKNKTSQYTTHQNKQQT
eukprot:TRINITY_DN663_c0_g1_i3.p1 TRINITY_DN663_c0_g1~~TRINITY_DN663_c0_g1_i3.p1  ORF type:complete len:159 (-),score=38.37 TRINITY_DN663_c0_g1_i3:36-512(-)